MSRQELEWPAPGGLDLKHPDLRAHLSAPLRKALAPVFTVTINRRQRTLDFRGSKIELALDQGEARRDDQFKPICEVELELKAGSSADLFELARLLSEAAPLRLSFLGKASQGHMLVHPKSYVSQEPALIITHKTPAGVAFEALARRALVDLALHSEAYSDHASARTLHALRVSTRRLKSYLTTFGALLDEASAKAMRRHMNWLLQATAEARNLDAFAQIYLQPAAPIGLADAVRAAGAAAHGKTQGVLASKRFRGLLLDLAAWVETEAWRNDKAKVQKARLRPVARKTLDRALRSVRRHAGDLRTFDAEARHQVRLKIKRLRYILEAFEPLYASQGIARYLKILRAIQSDLGDLNDAASAQTLLAGLDLGRDGPASFALVQAQAAELEARLAITNRKLSNLLRRPSPWST